MRTRLGLRISDLPHYRGAPVVAPSSVPSNSRTQSGQQFIRDLQTVRSWYKSGSIVGGLYLPDWAYQDQDSSGTAVAAAGQVVGKWWDATYADRSAGNHAVQTTTANKPLSARTSTTLKNYLSADSTDVLPVTFPSALGSSCTIARATPAGVTFSESQTISATWNGLISPYQYNSAVLVANRALSAGEKAVVSRVLGRYVPALGTEIITNGRFDLDTSGWSVASASELASENGLLKVTSSSSGGVGAQQAFTSTAGKQYTVSGEIKNGTGTDVRVRANVTNFGGTVLGESSVISGTLLTSVSFVVIATGAITAIYLRLLAAASGNIGYFDNISVKEVL